MTRRRLEVGAAGEAAARAYLEEKGYAIEELNFRCPLGEIDIIAREGSMLVFCEVRTNTGGDLTAALESMTPSKLKRLRRLALYYQQKVYGSDIPCRFDFLAVLLDPENRQALEIKHIQNVVSG
mgnify:CR=1 FL=1